MGDGIGFDQQMKQQQGYMAEPKSPYTMYSEPNDLYEEICHRLEHYNSQLEKLRAELARVTTMRDVLAAAQNAYDKNMNVPNQVPGREPY